MSDSPDLESADSTPETKSRTPSDAPSDEQNRASHGGDAATDGLETLRVERDDARRQLELALAERDAAREALVTTLAAEKSLDERLGRLAREVREIHTLQTKTDLRVRFLHRELITDIQALEQLLARYTPEAPLPSVAGWALSPVGLLALVNVIESHQASTVVECGSGTSTLWIAYALKRLGRGRLIALEHLPEYAERTRSVLAEHGLTAHAEVRLAPLATRSTPRGDFPWYSFDATELTEPIDLLLVDGPPQSTGRHARYPALSVFADHLAPNALIIADDTDRPDEQDMLEYWSEDYPRLRRVESLGMGIEVLGFAPEA